MMAGENKSLTVSPDSDYRALLIRGWREGSEWRFSLETIGEEQQRRGFAGYNELAIYLKNQFVNEDGDPVLIERW